MKVLLSKEDIRPEHRHLPMEEVEFYHLEKKVQKVVDVAGLATFFVNRMYEKLISPETACVHCDFSKENPCQLQMMCAVKDICHATTLPCLVCGGTKVQSSGVRGERPCIACDGTGERQ